MYHSVYELQPFNVTCLLPSHGWQPLFTIIFYCFHRLVVLLRDAMFQKLSLFCHHVYFYKDYETCSLDCIEFV